MDRAYPAVLGRALFDLRTKSMGCDQKHVGSVLGISQSHLSFWERGVLIPGLVSLIQLVNGFYGVCVQDLLITVAEDAVWDPRVPLLKIPQGRQILMGIPDDQPVLSAMVAYELGSRIPRR